MAMAHPNPGLGKRKVIRHYDPFRRVTSAPPDLIRLKQIIRPLDAETVDSIRLSAKELWYTEATRNKSSVTTYAGLHTHKNLDEPTQERVRPSSANRLNKPHPPTVFLVTRAKKVDGCYEPEKVASEKYGGKAKTDLDQYVNRHKNEIKRAMKGFPMQRSSSSFDDKDRERAKMQASVGSVPAQAAEAWIQLSNAKDQKAIQDQFKETEKRIKQKLEASKLPTTDDYLSKQIEQHDLDDAKVPAHKRQYPPTLRMIPKKNDVIYSTTRWLKRAGLSESENVRKLAESIRKAPPRFPPMQGPHFHITDYSPMFNTVPRAPYHDFQIHPEWHMPWHKKYALTAQQ